MSWVATAVIGGAVIGGVATKKGADKAADAQVASTKQASDTQLEMFNKNREDQLKMYEQNRADQWKMYDQAREDTAPWREAGATTIGQIMGGLTPGGEFAKSQYTPFTLADFMNDPGYKFRMEEGEKALGRTSAARGGLLSGGAMKEAMRYGQGLASQEYGDAFNRYTTDYNLRTGDVSNRFNRLASVAGLGQTSAGQIAGLGNQTAGQIAGLGNQTAGQIAGLGNQTAGQIGNNLIGAGNARAAGAVGGANALTNGIQTIGNYFMQQNMLNRIAPPASPATSGFSWPTSLGID